MVLVHLDMSQFSNDLVGSFPPSEAMNAHIMILFWRVAWLRWWEVSRFEGFLSDNLCLPSERLCREVRKLHPETWQISIALQWMMDDFFQ